MRLRDLPCMSNAPDDQAPIVLVVEDEPILRMNAAEILSEHGYRVVEAQDAEEALSLIRETPDIRVLFTDVNMPGMSGLELAEQVHLRWPDVLLLLTSGNDMIPAAQIPDAGEFVPKPYGQAELLRRVAALFVKPHS